MSSKNGDTQPAIDIVNTFVHKIKAENEMRRLDGFERVFLKVDNLTKMVGLTKAELPSIEEEKEIIDSFQRQLCEGRKRSSTASKSASNTTHFRGPEAHVERKLKKESKIEKLILSTD